MAGEPDAPQAGPLVAVLSYHKVGSHAEGGWDTWYYVPERRFAEHLRLLRDEGWRFLDAEAFLRGTDRPDTLPARAALVTFDDAYRSIVERALPIMQSFGCPGVVFVPTDYVGRSNDFDRDSREPSEQICSWDQLATLERAGVSAQSHSASHRAFSDLGPAEMELELRESQRLLEQRLGKTVDMFAFPYGDVGAKGDADQALRARGYCAAFLYGGRPIRMGKADPLALPRLAIGRDTDLGVELGLGAGAR